MPYFLLFSFFIGMTICIIGVFFSQKTEKSEVLNVGHGRASKIIFEDHSYVIWQQNLSDCIIHDPNCHCLKRKIEETK